jgi:hypothetical protein
MAASKVYFRCKPVEPSSTDIMVFAKVAVPQLPSGRSIGQRKFEDCIEPSNESRIKPASPVGRQQRDPVEFLDPLKEEIGLRIGVAVVRVADLGPGTEKGIGLVEEKEHIAVLGGVE